MTYIEVSRICTRKGYGTAHTYNKTRPLCNTTKKNDEIGLFKFEVFQLLHTSIAPT